MTGVDLWKEIKGDRSMIYTALKTLLKGGAVEVKGTKSMYNNRKVKVFGVAGGERAKPRKQSAGSIFEIKRVPLGIKSINQLTVNSILKNVGKIVGSEVVVVKDESGLYLEMRKPYVS